MSAAIPPPIPTTDPDPTRAAPAMPSRIGRVLRVVRRLIDIGRELAATIHQRATDRDFDLFAKPFGTDHFAFIVARITNGLRLALALEARLCQRAERGRDFGSAPIRTAAASAPRADRPPAPPEPEPAAPAQDPRLARLPTDAEIAAAVRRRPIGAVIVDILRDLGITPGQLDRPFWDELSHAVMAYGGSFFGWVNKLHKLMFALNFTPEERARPLYPEMPPGWRKPATHPP